MAQRKKTGRNNQSELAVEGKGVSRLHLAVVDELAEAYIKERDKRLIQTPKEVAAKRKLIEALHAHEDQIRQPDGELVYRYDEMRITLIPGKEKLRVEALSTGAEPE